MTTDLVADACVAAKWVLQESDSATAVRAYNETLAAGQLVYVLDIGETEVANVLRSQVRRRRMSPADATAAFAKFRTLVYRPLAGRPLLPTALDLALKYDVSVYDALFVAAVQHLGCDGVTADVPLHTAVSADFPNVRLLRHW